MDYCLDRWGLWFSSALAMGRTQRQEGPTGFADWNENSILVKNPDARKPSAGLRDGWTSPCPPTCEYWPEELGCGLWMTHRTFIGLWLPALWEGGHRLKYVHFPSVKTCLTDDNLRIPHPGVALPEQGQCVLQVQEAWGSGPGILFRAHKSVLISISFKIRRKMNIIHYM